MLHKPQTKDQELSLVQSRELFKGAHGKREHLLDTNTTGCGMISQFQSCFIQATFKVMVPLTCKRNKNTESNKK